MVKWGFISLFQLSSRCLSSIPRCVCVHACACVCVHARARVCKESRYNSEIMIRFTIWNNDTWCSVCACVFVCQNCVCVCVCVCVYVCVCVLVCGQQAWSTNGLKYVACLWYYYYYRRALRQKDYYYRLALRQRDSWGTNGLKCVVCVWCVCVWWLL